MMRRPDDSGAVEGLDNAAAFADGRRGSRAGCLRVGSPGRRAAAGSGHDEPAAPEQREFVTTG